MSATVRVIQGIVADHYGMTREQLLSKRRTRDIVRPRQIAIALCRQFTTLSLPRLGQMFGDLDHTTVMHAVKRVAVLEEQNRDLRADLVHLRRVAKARADRLAASAARLARGQLRGDWVWRFERVALRVGMERARTIFAQRAFVALGSLERGTFHLERDALAASEYLRRRQRRLRMQEPAHV
jgi:hypothetical protein